MVAGNTFLSCFSQFSSVNLLVYVILQKIYVDKGCNKTFRASLSGSGASRELGCPRNSSLQNVLISHAKFHFI